MQIIQSKDSVCVHENKMKKMKTKKRNIIIFFLLVSVIVCLNADAKAYVRESGKIKIQCPRVCVRIYLYTNDLQVLGRSSFCSFFHEIRVIRKQNRRR